MGDCPRKYINQGTDSFGDDEYVTTAMLLGFCSSLAWLKYNQQVLSDNADPLLRYWIDPMIIDTGLSYGMKPYNSGGVQGYEFDDTIGYNFETYFQQSPEAQVLANNAFQLFLDITNSNVKIDFANSGNTYGQVSVPTTVNTVSTTTWTADTNGAYYHTGSLAGTNNVLRILDKTNKLTYIRQTSVANLESSNTANSGLANGAWYHDLTNNKLYVKCFAGSGSPPSPNTINFEIELINCFSRGKSTSAEQITGVNTHWYVGFDRTKSFFSSPEEFAAELTDYQIPAVTRAQTFTSTITGRINSISLNIEGNKLAEDLIYVELRNVTNGAPGSTVYARSKVDPKKFAKTSVVTFPFSNPVPVSNGVQYAWVIRSPFTSFAHFVGVGGWGKNCTPDRYTGGDAFTSWDNGHTWMKHGRDEQLPYVEGEHAPQDFAFQVNTLIDPDVSVIQNITNTNFYVYFKPITVNPCTSCQLSVNQSMPTNTNIKWEVSSTRGVNDWHEIDTAQGWLHNWSGPNYPTRIWLRATLSTTSTSVGPTINGVTLTTINNPATSALLRTNLYAPRTDGMMGSKLWSRIYAPVDQIDSAATINVGVNNQLTTFNLPATATEPIGEVTFVNSSTGISFNYTEGEDFTVNYSSNPQTINFSPIVLPQGQLDFTTINTSVTMDIVRGTETEDVKSITTPVGTFNLSQFAAEPLSSVIHVNSSTGVYTTLNEYTDFTVNYSASPPVVTMVTTANGGAMQSIPVGIIKAEYYPLFIRGLTPTDFAITDDNPDGGIRLDLFDEQFQITTSTTTPTTFNLKAIPTNPVYEVNIVTISNGDVTTQELEFMNGGYTVNYNTPSITIPSNITVGTVIEDGDMTYVEVKYTPYLADNSLAIAYNLTRSATNKNVFVRPCYFQTRV